MRVLGVDPGYDRMGIAVIEGSRERPILLSSLCTSTDPKAPFHERLGVVCDALRDAIETHRPDALALEEIFFSNNQKTAIQVAEVRGAIILVARDAGLSIAEYNPSAIKIAVTGTGRADKTQVLAMLSKLIVIPDLKEKKRYDDEFDAIAVAITHLSSARYPHVS